MIHLDWRKTQLFPYQRREEVHGIRKTDEFWGNVVSSSHIWKCAVSSREGWCMRLERGI